MVSLLRRAVFLDRDGVLNEPVIRDGKPYPPRTAAEATITAGAREDLTRLKQAGFLLIVVTNQPDIRRGTLDPLTLDEIHRLLRSRLPLDDIFVCAHDDDDRCVCRKPLPGLLVNAAATHNVDVSRSYLIGDRWRDIDAGAAAGCQTVLIDYHYKERQAASPPDATVERLSQAVDWILQREREI